MDYYWMMIAAQSFINFVKDYFSHHTWW